MARDNAGPRQAIRKLNLIGLGTIAVLIGGLGSWASVSNMSGAVIATGALTVESSIKKVQHPTGGIVGKVLVEEGSAVEPGQVLVQLDDTVARTSLGIVRSELNTQLLRLARLKAERDASPEITLPSGLQPRQADGEVAADFASEKRLFEARRETLIGQRSQLRSQIEQIDEEVRGLLAEQKSGQDQIYLLGKELAGVAELYSRHLVSVDRQTTLEHRRMELEGEQGRLTADIARARSKISEVELQVLQIDKDFQTGVLNDLRDAEGKLAELQERRVANEDALRRIDIRAPQAGLVNELSIHTVGGVIGPGETIMTIVPRADALVVDARVAPQDVDQVAVGAHVAVRLNAANRRTTPTFDATITRISADLNREKDSNLAYYLVRAEFAGSAAASLRDLHLRPGMPIEAYIATEPRTPFQYLLQPLTEQAARAFRER